MGIKIFWLKLGLRRLLTKQLMYHRHIILQEQVFYDLCDQIIENCNRVIIGCFYAIQCWQQIEHIGIINDRPQSLQNIETIVS